MSAHSTAQVEIASPLVAESTTAPNQPANIERKPTALKRTLRRPGAIEVPLATMIVAAVLFYGWMQSGEQYLSPEEGAGYYLGIVGGVMMLALLIYPLRKRWRALRHFASVRAWFRLHMLLGIIGPALVVLHSNFKLGSLNSSVALVAMLAVAGSGYVGRFLYTRIHSGLHGKRETARSVRADLAERKRELLIDKMARESAEAALDRFEKRRIEREASLLSGLYIGISGPVAHRMLKRILMRHVRNALSLSDSASRLSDADRAEKLAAFEQSLDAYLRTTAHAERFLLYERLFSLWHLLHLPLFFLLVLAAVVHVIAVHLF